MMKTEMRLTVGGEREEPKLGDCYDYSVDHHRREAPPFSSDAIGVEPRFATQLGASGFELTSFAPPATWNVTERTENQVGNRHWLCKRTNDALIPLVDQLPLGASLVVTYDLAPKGDGALLLKCRLNVQAPTEIGARLNHELAMCLATLSEYFGFRDTTEPASMFNGPVKTWV